MIFAGKKSDFGVHARPKIVVFGGVAGTHPTFAHARIN
jgi:hypothetical protein